MARITVEDCLEVVDNRFELVMMAAKRARQLANGVEPQLDNSESQRQADRAGPARDRRPPDRPPSSSTPSRSPSASARSARRWNGPPPKWSPTTTCPRATTDRLIRDALTAIAPATRPRSGGAVAFAACTAPYAALPHCADAPRRLDAMQSPSSPRRTACRRRADDARAGLRARAGAGRRLPARPSSCELLRRAWAIGAAAHAGQTRKSGEPYITHPVAVAEVLAEQGLDVETLIAAILHDTIEDTPLTREAIASEFGETVAELVDGVTKLDKLQFRDRQEAAAESFRKMLLAMSRDLRVILIKLADRLHNMRTLGAQSAEARRAHRARDAGDLRADRAAPGHEPDQGRAAGPRLPRAASVAPRGDRKAHPHPAGGAARVAGADRGAAGAAAGQGEAAAPPGQPGQVAVEHLQQDAQRAQELRPGDGRVRLPHRRAQRCRSATTRWAWCTRAYKPLDARFRDFIAIPKANGYQSLHTVLFGPYGSPIEVQIRTEEMDLIAERGIAAHWSYKHGGDSAATARRAARTAGSRSLVESQRVDRLVAGVPRERQGRPVPGRGLPVHAQGRHPVAAAQRHRARLRLRGAHRRRQPRGRRARGQASWCRCAPSWPAARRVEIITAKSSTPKPQWLEFVVSGKARTAIRHQLKQLEHEDAVQLGHRMLDRALEALDTLARPRAAAAAGRATSPSTATRAWRRCWPTSRSATACRQQVAQALAREAHGQAAAARRGAPPLPRGQDPDHRQPSAACISFANCCLPIPGDEIMGYHTAGKGIVVHRAGMPERRRVPQVARALGADRLGPRGAAATTAPRCSIEVDNRPGVLAQVAAAIAEAESNIDRVEYLERDTQHRGDALRDRGAATASTWPT